MTRIKIKWFDAVRAYGLFLVLGYHLFYDFFPGGFLGVDIFFTFSGFLVTAIAIEEVRNKGRFGLFGFYKRRARRIVIPLFFSVIFTLPFLLLIPTDFSVGIAKQTAAALGFVTNWFQIQTGGSYEAQLLPSVYIHTWSLAIEMQFYLTWGLVCALLAKVSKRLFAKDSVARLISFKALILVISGALAVGSYLFMHRMHSAGSALDAIYFNTFARFFPFFIGAFAASIWGIYENQYRGAHLKPPSGGRKLKTAALVVVTTLAAAVIFYESTQYKFTDDFIFHYGFLLTSLLTVILIYGTHGLHRMTPREKEEPRLLRAVGDVSYNSYLFHWPFYVVFTALILDHLAASLVTLVFTFVFSALVFYKAERVFSPRGRMKDAKHRRVVAAFVSAATVVSIAAGGVVMYRAPVITSIEADFAMNHVVSDAEGVIALERGVSAINENPLEYGPLLANILDSGASVPAPAPPEPAPPPDAGTGHGAEPTQPVPAPHEPAPPTPQPTPAPAHPPSIAEPIAITGGVTVIGDSVPLGAQSAMTKIIPDCHVDAEVSRPVSAGLSILTALQQRGQATEYVVIALGTNGTTNYEKLFTQMIEALEPGQRLVVITPFDGRSNENARILNNTAEWMRGLPYIYDFITIADWNALISTQVNLLAGDRVHMGGQSSMTLYAEMVAEALNTASQRPAKAP